MLDNAKKYEPELVKLFYDVAYDPFYNFQQILSYRETFKIPETTWDGNYFVSMFEGKIIGYVEYSTNRSANYAHGLNILHFNGNRKETALSEYYVFGKDVMTAVRDVFEKFGFNKLNFCVVIGNPIEKTYDKLIKRYGGRIVGVFRRDKLLIDGKLHDIKCYEILAEEYFARKSHKKD